MFKEFAFGLALLTPTSVFAAEGAPGPWTVLTTKDPFDDSHQTSAINSGDNGSLEIKCQTSPNKIVRATIITSKFLGRSGDNDLFAGQKGKREVDYRFGEEALQKHAWYYSDQSAFPIEPETKEFWRMAARSRKLVVRVYGYDFAPTTINFTLDGADAIIKSIYKECGEDF